MKSLKEQIQDTEWKNVSFKEGFATDTNFPLRYRIKAGVLYIAGVLIKNDGEIYSSANTNVFSIPVTLYGPMHFQAMVSSAAFELTSAGGQASGYINASGEAFVRNTKQNAGTYMHIEGVIPLD